MTSRTSRGSPLGSSARGGRDRTLSPRQPRLLPGRLDEQLARTQLDGDSGRVAERLAHFLGDTDRDAGVAERGGVVAAGVVLALCAWARHDAIALDLKCEIVSHPAHEHAQRAVLAQVVER